MRTRLFLLFLLLAASPVHPVLAARLSVIVHQEVPADSLSRSTLADIFTKRKRQWNDGTLIRPVDLADGTPARNLFLRLVLRRTPHDMTRYWIGQKLVTGDYPPLKLDQQREVVYFVSSTRGAIGYVTNLSEDQLRSVKVVAEFEE